MENTKQALQIFRNFQQLESTCNIPPFVSEFMYPLVFNGILLSQDTTFTNGKTYRLGGLRAERYGERLLFSILADLLKLEPIEIASRDCEDKYVKLLKKETRVLHLKNQQTIYQYGMKVDIERAAVQIQRFYEQLSYYTQLEQKPDLQKLINETIGPGYYVPSDRLWISYLLTMKVSLMERFFGQIMDPYRSYNKHGIDQYKDAVRAVGKDYERLLNPSLQINLDKSLFYYHWGFKIGKKTSNYLVKRVLQIVNRKLEILEDKIPYPELEHADFMVGNFHSNVNPLSKAFHEIKDFNTLFTWLLKNDYIIDNCIWRNSTDKFEPLALRNPIIESGWLSTKNKTEVGRLISEQFGFQSSEKTLRSDSKGNRKELENFFRKKIEEGIR